MPFQVQANKGQGDFEAASASWLTGYNYRQGHNLIGAGAAGTNYQIKLNITRAVGTSNGAVCYVGGHCLSNYGDLRFTSDDGLTLLSYWIDGTLTTTSALVWVKISASLSAGANVTMYVYYGNTTNAGGVSASSGTGTFLFFDNFETGTLAAWSYAGAYWSVGSSVVKAGTYAALGIGGATAASRTLNRSLSTLNSGAMWRSWFRTTTITANEMFPLAGTATKGTGSAYLAMVKTDDVGSANGTYYYYTLNVITTGTWYLLEVGWDKVGHRFLFYLNYVYKGWLVDDYNNGTTVSSLSAILAVTDAAATKNMYLDDYFIRSFVSPEPTQGAWDSVIWRTVNTADLSFNMPALSLREYFVVFGLILIPVSTLYMVHGGLDEASNSKTYVFLLLFFFGWALLIGGIMP